MSTPQKTPGSSHSHAVYKEVMRSPRQILTHFDTINNMNHSNFLLALSSAPLIPSLYRIFLALRIRALFWLYEYIVHALCLTLTTARPF